jgi:hypothetical protein
MTATTYISHCAYANIPASTRAALLEVLSKAEIVQRYASNVESDLRNRGEHELAKTLYK